MKKLWDEYARSWSQQDEAARQEIYAACLADNITYCDPMMSTRGYEELSAYMAGFQQQLPGHSFVIGEVIAHNDRCLAKWTLTDSDNAAVHEGTSFAQVDEKGRLSSITGFFPVDYYTGQQD